MDYNGQVEINECTGSDIREAQWTIQASWSLNDTLDDVLEDVIGDILNIFLKDVLKALLEDGLEGVLADVLVVSWVFRNAPCPGCIQDFMTLD